MPGLVEKILRFCLLLLFLTGGRIAFGETYFTEEHHDIDSLKKVLENAKDAERVRALCLLAREYRIDSAAISIQLTREAYQVAQALDDPALLLYATYSFGLACHHSGDYPGAIRYSFDARDMALEQRDTAMLYQVMHCIVLSYLYSNNFDLAIQQTHITLGYLINWTHPAQQFEKEIRVGWVYMMARRHREALHYYLRAEEFAGMTSMVPAPKRALLFMHITNCCMQLKEYDSAKIYIDKIEKICHEEGLNFIDYGFYHKGNYFLNAGQYDSAEAIYKDWAQSGKGIGSVYDELSAMSSLGKLYSLQNRIPEAIDAYEAMIPLADWIRLNKSYFLDRKQTYDTWYISEQSVPDYIEQYALRYLILAHGQLYRIYKTSGQEGKALEHYESFYKAEERNRELHRNMQVMEINTRYETERKEQQILLLTSENELSSLRLEQTRYFLFALAGFILLVILVAVLLIRQNRMKALQDKTILEQRLLRAQMNPHFLFNTLSNIQGYMMENDMDKASHYLSRFSKLMRNILDNTAQEFITLEDEVSTIENYLELQRVRFPGKFDYILEVDETLDPEITMLPPMLAQPFIENSVEHGIRHLKAKGLITVRYTTEGTLHVDAVNGTADALIHIEVIDNGIGRVAAKQIENELVRKHRPMATAITLERLNVLGQKAGRKLRKKVKMEIEDLADEQGNALGTRVRIWAPLSSR